MSNSCDPIDRTMLLSPWDSQGKSTGVGCHALLQEIFLTQGSKSSLLCLPALLKGSHHNIWVPGFYLIFSLLVLSYPLTILQSNFPFNK